MSAKTAFILFVIALAIVVFAVVALPAIELSSHAVTEIVNVMP